MMVKKNKDNHKPKTIKIRSNSTRQGVEEQLENQQYSKELSVSIKQCENGLKFLSQITSSYPLLGHITSLSLTLNNFIDLDIANVFLNLNNLSNLTSFSFRLMNQIRYQNTDFQIGSSIACLKNLETLKLDIYNFLIPTNSEVLKLQDTYTSLKKLKNLEIILKDIPSNSNILYQIFDGLSNQLNLERLSLSICLSDIRGDVGFDLFIQELKYLVNLTELKINLRATYNGSNAFQLRNSIKHLTKIEKLKLIMPICKEYNYNLVSELQTLNNLKYLKYFSQLQDLKSTMECIHELSKLNHLDQTNIRILISNRLLNPEDYLNISNAISKIPNLRKLQIQLASSPQVNFIDQIDLLLSLRSQQKLIKLNVILQQKRKEEINFQQKLLDCIDSFKNLQEFHFRVQQQIPIDSAQGYNQFIQLCKNSLNLEVLSFQIITYLQATQVQSFEFGDNLNNLTNLRKLIVDIRGLHFQKQDDIIQFFNGLKNKHSLECLDLFFQGRNSFDNELCQSLGNSFMNLQNLKKLNLQLGYDGKFDEVGISNISQGFRHLKQLKEFQIKLFQTKTTFKDICPILHNLKELTNLKYMELKLHTFPDGAQFIEDILPKITFPSKLQSFNFFVKQKGFKFENIQGIFEGLEELKYLSKFSINFDIITIDIEQLKLIENQLSNIKTLESFFLDLSQFQIVYLISLFQKLPFLQKIIYIDQMYGQNYYYSFLQRDVFYKQDCQKHLQRKERNQVDFILYYFKEFTLSDLQILVNFLQENQLKKLQITIEHQNNLNNDTSYYLFSNLNHQTKLISLELIIESNCEFGLQTFIQIGKTLQSLSQLEQFSFSINSVNNSYRFQDLENIFLSLRYLQNLKNLSLEFIDFQENIDHETYEILFISIGNQCQLQELKIKMFEMIDYNVIKDLMKIYFIKLTNLLDLKIDFWQCKQNQSNAIIYYKNLRLLNQILSITTSWKSMQQKRILLRMKRLVVINDLAYSY